MRWAPHTPGFYKPRYGASKFKWHFEVPYVRERPGHLHHYPEISRVTGKPIDWYHDEPQDGYEATRVYGEHTLELKGMPMGRTPEYMQERLRRFFAKFGRVEMCRADPHPRDPYQCEGTAYVTFRDKAAAMKALQAPLKFPASLHDKVVSMRHLDTDKRNDPGYYTQSKFWDKELVSLARQLHAQLVGDPSFRVDGKPFASVGSGLIERELVPTASSASSTQLVGRAGVPPSQGAHTASRLSLARTAVVKRFGSWDAFLAEAPFDELFSMEMAGEGDAAVAVVRPRLVSAVQRARILHRARAALARRQHEEFSVWWREGKVPLPEYTQRRVTWWDHKPKLPFDLQIMSRSKDIHRIHDERFLFKMKLRRVRNENRKEKRGEYNVERKKLKAEKEAAREERRQLASAPIKGTFGAGISSGLVTRGWIAEQREREAASAD